MSEPRWKARARARLVGQPRQRLRVSELLDVAGGPPCVLPWTRLEVSTRRLLGPCCPDYQAAPTAAPDPLDLGAAWNGAQMRAFRRALGGAGRVHDTCRQSCPILQGGRESTGEMRLVGGSAAFVDNQLLALEDVLAGREHASAAPLELMVVPTTFCNYNCLMCEWGEEGTLDDELPASFYESLSPWLPTLRAFELAGGEPLASPVFRAFLESLDVARAPDLRLSLVTNGSYLTDAVQDRLASLPWATLTISINAATPELYAAVNRGLPYGRVRGHLDALIARRRRREISGGLTYSMVLLRQNHHEIEAFARMAERDGAEVRFMLPMFDRNGESIMTDASAMHRSHAALERVAGRLKAAGADRQARGVLGEARVLAQRLAAGLCSPLPDGRAHPSEASS